MRLSSVRPRTLSLMAGLGLCLASFPSASAQDFPPGFRAGDVITEFGPVADIDANFVPAPSQAFKVVFDADQPASEGGINRDLMKVARFINMHGEDGGIDPRPLDIVLVVHGQALGGLVKDDPSAPMIEALLAEGVRVVVCGQSMKALQIPQDAFVPGVEVALSAMTAHASFMAEGYHSMPF